MPPDPSVDRSEPDAARLEERAAEMTVTELSGGVGADPAPHATATVRRLEPADLGVGTKRRRDPKKFTWFVWLAVIWIVLVVAGAVLADVLPIRDPNATDVPNRLKGLFTPGHPLGTDGLGRDILARIIYGARVSLIISLSAVTIGSVVGGTLGMLTGYLRGWLEAVVMGVVNILLAFPALVILLLLVAMRGQSLSTITLVIGFLSIPIYTRVARAVTLTVARREYVLAAQAMGATKARILVREIMPNVALPVLAFGLVALGVVIVAEGSLAFLGLSVQPPNATWGSMILEGRNRLNDALHVALVPSTVMLLTVLSLNYVGDALRSKFDVRESAL